MTNIEQKALELVNEIERQEGLSDLTPRIMRGLVMDEALCRAIERHEAFRQEVSDAIVFALKVYGGHSGMFDPLRRFIIAKPDPLVDAFAELGFTDFGEGVDEFRAALAKRGLEIREKE